MNRVLIIDDNHSFIDMFKNMVLPLRLQVDASHRYRSANELIEKNGAYLNYSEIQRVQAYHQQQNAKKGDSADEKSSRQTEPLVLKEELINENGYSLIVIEQDSETAIKGIDFIRDQITRSKRWTPDNFILFTGNLEKVEEAAKKLGIAVFEKPLKKANVMNSIQSRLAKVEQLKNTSDKLVETYKIAPPAPKGRRKKVTKTKK